MIWVWNFILYSFFGFLLEVAYARATGGRGDRKSLLVLPLCPVYGVGACLILLLPRTVIQNPFTLFLLGGLAATAAEYGMAILYERGLGVSFWDYTGLPGSIQGKICLPFSLAWGALALPLIYFVHPAVARLTALIPPGVTWTAAATVAADMAVSGVLMKVTGNRDCLPGRVVDSPLRNRYTEADRGKRDRSWKDWRAGNGGNLLYREQY